MLSSPQYWSSYSSRGADLHFYAQIDLSLCPALCKIKNLTFNLTESFMLQKLKVCVHSYSGIYPGGKELLTSTTLPPTTTVWFSARILFAALEKGSSCPRRAENPAVIDWLSQSLIYYGPSSKFKQPLHRHHSCSLSVLSGLHQREGRIKPVSGPSTSVPHFIPKKRIIRTDGSQDKWESQAC